MSSERGLIQFLLTAVFILIFPVVAHSDSDCGHLTATGSAEYPPYLWRDPTDPLKLIGANADVIKYLGERVGIQIDFLYSGPWSRAQEEVRTGRIDLLAGYIFTKIRQQNVDFIAPPFIHSPTVVWVRKDNTFQFQNWDDLRGYIGGVVANSSNGQAFDDYAAANLHLESVTTANQAFQKLLLKRNDYVIFKQFPGAAIVNELGVEGNIKALKPPVSSEGLYLALSKSSRCSEPLLRERLSAEMQKIVESSVPEMLVKLNLDLWNTQQKSISKR